MGDVRSRLLNARLYLITPARPPAGPLDVFLPSVLDSGVDMVQLREKNMDARELLSFCEVVRRRTAESGALFILNDRVDVAIACGADGVHLGQDDLPLEEARRQMGDALIGLSTHSEADIAAARESEADYIAVGPIYQTPTKPGRPAVGLELVRYAALRTDRPFFAIGGIDLSNLEGVLEAGAERISVLRALTDAPDPAAVARKIGSLLGNR